MARYGKHPRLARDTAAPDDAVWHWFVCNGPHGERFEWANGHLGLLRKFIEEHSSACPDFEVHARTIAVDALQSEDSTLVLKGVHVLTAIGSDAEMRLVVPFAQGDSSEVSKHARTALFERGIKTKKK